MKKKAEMLQKINALRKNVVDLLAENKMEEAKKASDELDVLMKDYEKMPNEKAIGKVENKMDKMKEIKKAVNSYLHRGWNGMEDAERALLKPTNATEGTGQVTVVGNRGGIFVPVEVADFAAFMSTGVYRLRTRFAEYFANTKSGTIPLANNPTAGLVEMFDELPTGGIARKDIKFGSVDWTVNPYGVIVPVSNELIADASADILGIISEIFFRAQVITENNLILAALDTAGTATAATSWKDVVKALNEVAPVGGGDKVLITNTDGWNALDTATDDNGLPILTVGLVDSPKRTIRGYEVIQLPNAVLSTDETDGIPMYAVSPKDAAYFIERKGLEISYNPYSDSAYSKDAVDVRVTCRMTAKLKFADAVKKLNYKEA